MSKEIVSKYGGTSVAQIESVVENAENHPEQRIIVPSAPGKLEDGDTKVTDLLINYIETKDDGRRRQLRNDVLDRFQVLFKPLGSDDATALINQAEKELDSPRTATFTISRGEYYSARCLALLLDAQFLDARDVFYFRQTNFDLPASEWAIQNVRLHAEKNRVVIPGYYGQDAGYHIRLFARGGSDRSGAILAANLGMDYENWTDQDGIYSADPRIVRNARVIGELSREEVREGAHGGAGILQGDTIIDLNGSETVTTIRNTFNPSAPGTKVLPHRQANPTESVVALSSRDDLMEITVRDMGMAQAAGYMAHLLARFSELGLSAQHMPAAQDAFSITTAPKSSKEDDVAAFREAIDEFETFARDNLRTKTGSVEVAPVGVVYAVGEGLRDPVRHNQAETRIMQEILAKGMSVKETVTHHTSPSIALLVRPEYTEPILHALHKSEIEGSPNS